MIFKRNLKEYPFKFLGLQFLTSNLHSTPFQNTGGGGSMSAMYGQTDG